MLGADFRCENPDGSIEYDLLNGDNNGRVFGTIKLYNDEGDMSIEFGANDDATEAERARLSSIAALPPDLKHMVCENILRTGAHTVPQDVIDRFQKAENSNEPLKPIKLEARYVGINPAGNEITFRVINVARDNVTVGTFVNDVKEKVNRINMDDKATAREWETLHEIMHDPQGAASLVNMESIPEVDLDRLTKIITHALKEDQRQAAIERFINSLTPKAKLSQASHNVIKNILGHIN
jgi:hypothetical protein